MEKNTICYTSLEECIHSRRCFMTGEYCSKQTRIQKDRKELHQIRTLRSGLGENKEFVTTVNAFVIMNFSDMSDVMYKWRIKTFIESLARYLYVNKEKNILYCRSSLETDIPEGYLPVNKIQVVRSDSDPASNYVICSRICQQMQIADLVIVDVSTQNTNVFYEFGMAVAMGKMILPICYSESFYKREVPGEIEEKWDDSEITKYEKHIGCYPWRRSLFEHYGILYKKDKQKPDGELNTSYLSFEDATHIEKGFQEDQKYARFPYDEQVDYKNNRIKDSVSHGNPEEKIGRKIYERLRNTYNHVTPDNNTLIVYTMDGFLNEEEAGRCIVNFNHYITKRMKLEKCFCGDRVGVLVQDNAIIEAEKDSKVPQNLLYSIGEVIHIGMNQATYLAQSEKIKTREFLEVPECMRKESPEVDSREYPITYDRSYDAENKGKLIRPEQKQKMIISVKRHIRNRCMQVYPNDPVYVNRVKDGLQSEILESYSQDDPDKSFFCLYYVMLWTLKYTNEIVVDISGNDIQALFWLGAAHGSDVHAITVKHEGARTGENSADYTEHKERNVFDVAGLWTAILHSYDTEGFYRQLDMAQIGIERHSQLMIKNMDYYEKNMREFLLSFSDKENENEISSLQKSKRDDAMHVLESYYRRRFWNQMLRYNRLRIYLPQVDAEDKSDNRPRVHAVKWDVDAISQLSYYLSKRTVIGEYRFETLKKGSGDTEAKKVNFICIGDGLTPLEGKGLSKHVAECIDPTAVFDCGYNIIHHSHRDAPVCHTDGADNDHALNVKMDYKGFVADGLVGSGFYTHHPSPECLECSIRKEHTEEGVMAIYQDITAAEKKGCSLCNDENAHIQIAQLILWRDLVYELDLPEDENQTLVHQKRKPLQEEEVLKQEIPRACYRVEINGSSGPATFGLSTLFVDNSQKKDIYGQGDKWEEHNLLCSLQEKVREMFMQRYLKMLMEKLEKVVSFVPDCENNKFQISEQDAEVYERQKKRYISLVKHSVSIYLSSVLYRYFLPFLSEVDIDRIYNSVQNYVISMAAAKESPFAYDYPNDGDPEFDSSLSWEMIERVNHFVPETLKQVLDDFRGVEAFYKIHVRLNGKEDGSPQEQDTREIVDIEEIEDDFCSVYCIFTDVLESERARKEQ